MFVLGVYYCIQYVCESIVGVRWMLGSGYLAAKVFLSVFTCC